MTKPLSEFCKDEYEGFVADLRDIWSVSQVTIQSLSAELKPMHRKFLSLACIATITAQGAARNEYLLELVEASHLSMILAVKGIENPCYVLLRQTIELLLKHIYFSSHSVEYGWAQSREDYRDLTYQFLLGYLRRTDEISTVQDPKSIVDRLDYFYGMFSRYVHVHSDSFIRYGKLREVKNQPASVGKMNQRINELWPILIVILIASLPRKVLSASVLECKLIRAGLPKKYRDLLDGCLKTIALAPFKK
jgi:hypothetical protein